MTDGVSNILKNLGPSVSCVTSWFSTLLSSTADALLSYQDTDVHYRRIVARPPFPDVDSRSLARFTTTYYDYKGVSHKYTSYATFLCYTKNSRCSPMTYQNTTDPVTGAVTGGGFAPNPNSIYDDEIRPRYQLQTTYLKNGLNNACE